MTELPPSEQVIPNEEGDLGAELPDGPMVGPAGRGRTLRADAWRRLKKNKLAMAGLIWVIFMIVLVASADLWVPHFYGDPTAIDSTTVAERSLLRPSWEHPFGTDKLGRDMLSRTIYGGRASIMVGVVAVLISVTIGLGMGALAGYFGGWSDSFVMRMADIFLSFPYILFAITLVSVLGRGTWNLFLAIGLLGWPGIARVFRSSILSVKENEYVDASRALGASHRRIVFRHIAPNAVAPIIVLAAMSIGGAILGEAGLSFLGFGVQPPDPSWGNMLQEARTYMFNAPWLMLFPGLACVSTVLGFVLLGDGLRDALDVKLKE